MKESGSTLQRTKRGKIPHRGLAKAALHPVFRPPHVARDRIAKCLLSSTSRLLDSCPGAHRQSWLWLGYPQPANHGAVRQIKTGHIITLSKIVSLVGSKLYRFKIAPMIEGYK